VVLLRASIDGIAAYHEKIVVDIGSDKTIEANVPVDCLANVTVLNDLVVLANKSFGNPTLAQILKNKIKDSPLVFLQNGLDVEQPFLDNGYKEIYRCVMFATSQVMEHGRLRFMPVATSMIGAINGKQEKLETIVGCLNNAYFPFQPENNIQPFIWTKTIINSIFNSVCPLLETDNGIFHRNKGALHLAKDIIAECVGIAACKDIFLDEERVLESLLQISRYSDGQLISTYQDILNRRPTEIASMNLAIASLAQSIGRNNKVNRTLLLGQLVQLKADIAILDK
jgi:2-dehydropantoate 2-reductase